jgi:hypothetical protein
MSRTSILGGMMAVILGITGVTFVAGLVFGLASGLIAHGANQIDHAQRRSRVNAILIRIRHSLYTRLYSQ